MTEHKDAKSSRSIGRPSADPDEVHLATVAFRCHTAEKAFIAEQARLAGLKPGPYCRRRVLGLPLSPSQLQLDPKKLESLTKAIAEDCAPMVTGTRPIVPPGLLHELSRLSVKITNIGNLANQLARAAHTDGRFKHDWEEVRDGLNETKAELAEVLAKVGAAFDD